MRHICLPDPEIKLTGYDPYDGLNATPFACPLFRNSKLLKIGFIQLNKRSPINLRKLFLIPKSPNPKALALLILSYIHRNKHNIKTFSESKLSQVTDLLLRLKDKRYKGWGYPFPWQSRSFYFEKYLSNTVVSSFVGRALIELVHYQKKENLKDDIEDILNFILNHLNRSYEGTTFCFSYSPHDQTRIFNASLLAGSFLIDYLRFINKRREIENLLEPVFYYSVNNQKQDGSWPYGKDRNQQWIDGFHTGYNLCSLMDYYELSEDKRILKTLIKGKKFYINNFFHPDGRVKYYHDTVYPVDIHSVAQAIITFNRLKHIAADEEERKSIEKIKSWTYKHMWHRGKKYYYFRKLRLHTIKINYHRWSQSWMYYALSLDERENR